MGLAPTPHLRPRLRPRLILQSSTVHITGILTLMDTDIMDTPMLIPMAIMPLLALCILCTVDFPIPITPTLLALFMLSENVRPSLHPRLMLVLKLGMDATMVMDTGITDGVVMADTT